MVESMTGRPHTSCLKECMTACLHGETSTWYGQCHALMQYSLLAWEGCRSAMEAHIR